MDGETVARFGQLHPDLAAARKFRQEVYVAEVLLDRLYRHALREPRYQPISKFPAVERDFSFVFDDAVTFERIKSAVEELGISELQKFVPAEDLSAARRPEPASIPSCSTPSSSRRSAPCATTKWRSGRRRSSPGWNRWAACCARRNAYIGKSALRSLSVVITSEARNLLPSWAYPDQSRFLAA